MARQLIDYLHDLERRGETHVFLDEGARHVMREIQKPAMKQPAAATSSPDPADSDGGGAADEIGDFAALRAALKSEAKSPSKGRKEEPAEARSVATAATANSEAVKLGEGDATARLQALAAEAERRHSAGLGHRYVSGSGPLNPALAFVGEAPDYHDERSGSPFAGPAGEKLGQILKAMNLSHDEVYLTHLVKFRPLVPGRGMRKREPDSSEVAGFLPLLKAELELVKPRMLVALGEVTGRGLLSTDDPLEQMRGVFHEFGGLPLRVTHHPRYLLHQDSVSNEKRQLWEDMLALMERLELPISEKQRGYFRKKD